jgi:hypothetical protein
MTAFPSSIIPSTRTYSPGAYPHTVHGVYDGSEARVRHSNTVLGVRLRLFFPAITTAELLTVISHYAGQSGRFLPFAIPNDLLSGVTTPADFTPSGHQWRYSARPTVEDISIVGGTNRHNLTIELETVPPENTIVPGVRLRARATLQAGSAQLGEFFDVYAWLDAGAGAAADPFLVTATLTAGAGSIGGDPLDPYVSLQLALDGTNGSTTFTDTSKYGFTVTPSGNAQISTAQSKWGGASLRLDGTGDYLTIADNNNAFNFGRLDFTIEFWMYLDASIPADGRILINKGNWPTATASFLIYYGGSREVALYASSNGSSWDLANSQQIALNPALSTWHHVAITRNNGTLRGFLNGTLGFTHAITGALQSNSYPLRIGAGEGAAAAFMGSIDDLRITKGFAHYTAAFTPPTAGLRPPVVDQSPIRTVLQLAFGGANGSTVFADASNYGLDVTRFGNAQISTAQSKWGGSSGLFDGNGDYLSIPATPAAAAVIDLSGSAFTIEMWVYPLAYKADSRLVAIGGGTVAYNATNGIHLLLQMNGSGAINLQYYVGTGSPSSHLSVATAALNVFTHIAVSMDESNVYLAVGGVVESFSRGAIVRPTAAAWLEICSIPGESGSSTIAYHGYLDDLRIIRGEALYKAAYTPPTGAFTAPPAADPFVQNRVLMLHAEGPDTGTTFIDSSPNARTVTPSGNAQHTTTTPLVGTSSLLVDGTGDYLTIPTDQAFDFGTGDFTLEAYLRTGAFLSDTFILSASGSGGLFFGFQTPTLLGIGRNAVAWDHTVTHGMATSTIHHVAVTRAGTSLRFFVNGTQVGSTFTNNLSYNLSTTSLNVGSQGANYYFNGRLDEIRVTAGIARYTANFTPSAPFPDT